MLEVESGLAARSKV